MTGLICVARARSGHIFLCTLALISLAACGADDPASTAAAGSTSTASLISPRVGMIDRTPGTGTTPSQGATPTTPTSGTGGGSTPPVQPGIPPVNITNGTATLDWTPPTQNSDGSTLSNLAGYTVYYGTSPDQLTQSVKLTNPGLTAYTVSNLSPGKWYFSVTSYSSTGVESIRSGVVSTTI
jgi:Fibronectin type III domain